MNGRQDSSPLRITVQLVEALGNALGEKSIDFVGPARDSDVTRITACAGRQ
jgi:hypothetical protein